MAIEHMKTWRVGRVEITRLVEVWKWEDDIWMVLEDSKPSIVLTQPWLLPDHATPEGRMFINFQAFVVKAGDRRIMIDTCIGADRERQFPVFTRCGPRSSRIWHRSAIAPNDIDTVLCTHLHFDHVGWNTHLVDGRWVPTFPKARYLFSRKEYDHWLMLRDTGGYHGINHLERCRGSGRGGGTGGFHSARPSRSARRSGCCPRPATRPGHVSVLHQLAGRAGGDHRGHDASPDPGGHAGASGDLRHGQAGGRQDPRRIRQRASRKSPCWSSAVILPIPAPATSCATALPGN